MAEHHARSRPHMQTGGSERRLLHRVDGANTTLNRSPADHAKPDAAHAAAGAIRSGCPGPRDGPASAVSAAGEGPHSRGRIAKTRTSSPSAARQPEVSRWPAALLDRMQQAPQSPASPRQAGAGPAGLDRLDREAAEAGREHRIDDSVLSRVGQRSCRRSSRKNSAARAGGRPAVPWRAGALASLHVPGAKQGSTAVVGARVTSAMARSPPPRAQFPRRRSRSIRAGCSPAVGNGTRPSRRAACRPPWPTGGAFRARGRLQASLAARCC